MSLNLLAVLWIVVSDDVGLEVATDWIVIAGTLGQTMLLYRLLARPKRTAARLHLQSLGTLAACNALRALGVAHWSIRLREDLPLSAALAGLSLASFCVALWHRREGPAVGVEGEDGMEERAFEVCATPFGAELVGRFWPARPGAARPPLRGLLEQLVLPSAALVAGTLLEAATELGRASASGGPTPPSGWRRWAGSWHQALEALALLPQLRALLVLRREAGCLGAVPVPPDLTYWLSSTAIGHCFALVTSLAKLRSGGRGATGALALVCGEGFNTVVLGELLFAHFSSKWRGDKKVVLPA